MSTYGERVEAGAGRAVRQERSGMTPQEMIEKVLELSTADDNVVIVDEGSSANLRFAGNTLTTNGVSRSSQLTVISIVGRGVGVVSRAAVRPDQLDDVVAAADHAAEDARPSEDARPLLEGTRSGDWDAPAEPTSIGVFGAFAPALGEAFATAEAGGRRLYGFAEHIVTTTFVGTSTGARLRHTQPTGRLELNAKSSDMRRSAWSACRPAISRTSTWRLWTPRWPGAWSGRRTASSCPRAGTRRCCRRRPWPT